MITCFSPHLTCFDFDLPFPFLSFMLSPRGLLMILSPNCAFVSASSFSSASIFARHQVEQEDDGGQRPSENARDAEGKTRWR